MKNARPFVIALAVLLFATSASAQANPPSGTCTEPVGEQATLEAKAQFEQGAELFEQGSYERAIELWSAAYAKDCSAHELLLNLATAYQLQGELDKAIASLRRFNSRKPKSKYVKPNFKRILQLEDLANGEQEKRKHLAALTQQLEVARAVVPPSCEPPTTSAHTVVSAGLAGGGLFTALAGGAILFRGRSNESSAHQACQGDRTRCSDFAAVLSGESARSQIQLGATLAVAGAALSGVGALWYWLAPTASAPNSLEGRSGTGEPAPIRWSAAIAPSRMSLGLTGEF